MDKLERALEYIELGWYIFPCWWVDNGACACGEAGCRNAGKHPIPAAAPHGCLSASNDAKMIRSWWRRYPEANIALHCGPSGILAMDLDSYKDIYVPGAVEKLIAPEDEETVTNLTPSPGTHLLFANEHPYKNFRSLLPPGIDIRAWGAYIMLPGSNHLLGFYQWENDHSPFDIKPLPIPAKVKELLDRMDQQSKEAKARAQERAIDVTPDIALLVEALSYIPNWSASDKDGGLEYRDWLAVLMAVHSVYPGEEGVAICEAWSPGYEGEIEAKFKSFNNAGVTLGTTQHLATKYGWAGSLTEKFDGFSPEHTQIDLEAGAVVAVKKFITWPYALYNGRLVLLRENKEGETVDYPIADFTATITRQIITEHGDKIFVLSGAGIRGGEFEIEVPSTDFGNASRLRGHLDSVSAKDGIYYKMGDHLGPAIKRLTSQIETIRRYNRTGWADGRFLIPGRAPDGVDIQLDTKASAYKVTGTECLPAALEGLGAYCEGVGRYGTVILSHVLLPPLAGLAGWDNERYGLFIRGLTGSLKTSNAQAAMSVWGARFMTEQLFEKAGKHGATNPGIMGRAAELAGLPFMVDNFKPNTGDKGEMVSLIHALMEGYTKSRSTRTGANARSTPILCWPMFTGEDVPANDTAALARLLIVELESVHGDIPAATVKAQALTEHYPAVGWAWLEALESTEAARIAQIARATFDEYRKLFADHIRRHAPKAENILRSASNFAVNYAGWVALCEVKAFGKFFVERRVEHLETLFDLASAIGSHTVESLEASRYLSILNELVATDRVHIRKLAPMGEPARENTIGWYDETCICLYPDLTRKAIEEINRDALNGMSNNALYRQLEGLGALVVDKPKRKGDKVEHTVTKYDPNTRKSARVLRLTYDALNEDETEVLMQEMGLA